MVHQCIWTMSSQTEHPDAAWQLIKFLSSPEIWRSTGSARGWRTSQKVCDHGHSFENIIGIEAMFPPLLLKTSIGSSDGGDLVLNEEFTTAHVHPFHTHLS